MVCMLQQHCALAFGSDMVASTWSLLALPAAWLLPFTLGFVPRQLTCLSAVTHGQRASLCTTWQRTTVHFMCPTDPREAQCAHVPTEAVTLCCWCTSVHATLVCAMITNLTREGSIPQLGPAVGVSLFCPHMCEHSIGSILQYD